MSLRFSITVFVKPRVKQFIKLNYGFPCSFYRDKNAMFQIRLLLSRTQNNARIMNRNSFRPLKQDIYSEELKFYITEDDFNRFGAELSSASQIAFNNIFDNRLKLFMTSWVYTQYCLGRNISICIQEFQERFLHTEEIWKFEAIYKYCQRNHIFNSNIRRNEICEQLSKIVLAQMSKNRTLSQKCIETYENI